MTRILTRRPEQSTTSPSGQFTDASARQPCASCEARLLSVCRAVPESDLARLAETASVVDLGKGQTLIREGDSSAHLFNVTTGALKIYKLLPDGRRQVLGFLFTGDFLCLGGGATYGFTAEALTPAQLCRFAKAKFMRLLDGCPALERELLGKASSELSSAQEQMLLLGRKTARERIASFLVALSVRAERLGSPADRIHLPMTRTDIADYLGLTVETVSRIFSELRRQGQIRLADGGEVILLDPIGLKAAAEGHRPYEKGARA